MLNLEKIGKSYREGIKKCISVYFIQLTTLSFCFSFVFPILSFTLLDFKVSAFNFSEPCTTLCIILSCSLLLAMVIVSKLKGHSEDQVFWRRTKWDWRNICKQQVPPVSKLTGNHLFLNMISGNGQLFLFSLNGFHWGPISGCFL